MKYCSECGLPLRDTDKFCSSCGVKVSGDLQTATGDTGSARKEPYFSLTVEKELRSCPCILQLVKGFSVEKRTGGNTTIEYVALTNRGVFIFNLVNAIGAIREIPRSDYWECNGEEIDNPLIKSETDLESIKSYFLKRKFTNLFSYIVFPDSADSTNVNTNSAIRITKLSSLRRRLEDDMEFYSSIYSRDDLLQISRMLSPADAGKQNIMNITKNSLDVKPRWVPGKLVLGILTLVLAAYIFFQSFIVGIGNSILQSGEVGGTAGFIVALNFVITGIIAIAARKSSKKTPWIICTVFLFISCFIASCLSGSYSDLLVWGFLSLGIGAFYLLSAMRKPVGIIISIILIVLWAAFCYLLMDSGKQFQDIAASLPIAEFI